MFEFVTSPTELTTAATDLLLALVAAGFFASLQRERGLRRAGVRWWSATFASLAMASLLGAIAHGLALSPDLVDRIWLALNAFLALTMAVLALAVLHDWRKISSTRITAASFSAAGIFYLITLALPDSFLVFILYEAVIMVLALFVYITMVRRGTLPGARWLAIGIVTTMMAAVVQASGPFTIELIWAFDHNGIFHLVQLVGCVFLFRGVKLNTPENHGV